jgi:hypothetical protein
MTHADDPEDLGALGYPRREGPVPKLVVVAIAWAAFGVVGLLTALLMKSGGIAVFGLLCVLGGGALYLGQRTREQLEHEEARARADPWGEAEDRDDEPPDDDGDGDADDEPAARSSSSSSSRNDTTVYGAHEHDEDIVDAEFTEYFDYDQAPADQDDGTGYDEEEVAYQRYQADRRARETETSDAAVEEEEHDPEDGEPADAERGEDEDDVARTSRIPTGGGEQSGTSEGSRG